jgi:hypothetical protein
MTMARPECLLILSNDQYFPVAKTSQHLFAAAQRLSLPSIIRDTSDARFVCYLGESHKQPELLKEAETLVLQKWDTFLTGFHVDTVLSLDLQWLLVPDLLLDHPCVKSIYSIWFDDFRSWSKANSFFPARTRNFQEVIRHSKVTHCFYGPALAKEAQLLGIDRQRISFLAAPQEYTATHFPCTTRDRAAFIGNPGFRATPHAHIVKRMQEGAELDELRHLAREVILVGKELKKETWVRDEPTVQELLAVATEARISHPQFSALQILQLAGKHYPRAFEYLNERGDILDAALLVKMINQYDRPAVVWRLYQHQQVDVFSADHEWKPYGIEAKPPVLANELPELYRRYLFHLNAANCLRDATANEKLFEIAASGRVSLNIDSPDIQACYGPSEVIFVKSLSELESQAQMLFQEPDRALSMGKQARIRTSREHLWDHRLRDLFNLDRPPSMQASPSQKELAIV